MSQLLSFAADIRPLFRFGDITCMSRAGVPLDDANWMCVPKNAARVYTQLSSKEMPPDAPWPDAQITRFKTWMDQGCKP
jgi:hypothetical protein